jgi:PAS domain S-box-containing protein
MPRATVVASNVTPHEVDCILELPPPGSAIERVRRVVHAVVHADEMRADLEAQRPEMEFGMNELLRATGELRDLLDGLPDLVAVHRAGTILWVNRALVSGLAHENVDALLGKPLASIVHPSSHALLAERLARDADGLPALTEARLIRKGGEPVDVEVALAQPVTYGGVPARLVVARDVTERKHLHERLATSDRLASLGMLAAGVAHEINNPLAYAIMSTEVAARAIAATADEDVRTRALASLATALNGLGRVRAIVHDLRFLSHAEAESTSLVDVCAVVESTISLASSEIRQRARIVRDYTEVPPVRASEARLGQVILNLLVKAVDAMPDGGPVVHQLGVRVARLPERRVTIEVSDTGSGIPPEISPYVFDPFFTTKPAGRGTGLGLSICHRIVTSLGGTIDVRSTPGKGATFRVILPVAEEGP